MQRTLDRKGVIGFLQTTTISGYIYIIHTYLLTCSYRCTPLSPTISPPQGHCRGAGRGCESPGPGQVWPLPLPLWVVSPPVSAGQGRESSKLNNQKKWWLRQTTRPLATLSFRRWDQSWKNWSERKWSSIKIWRLSLFFLLWQLQAWSFVVRWRLGGDHGLLGFARIPQVVHLSRFAFWEWIDFGDFGSQISLWQDILFHLSFSSWLYNESPVKDTIVTNDRFL